MVVYSGNDDCKIVSPGKFTSIQNSWLKWVVFKSKVVYPYKVWSYKVDVSFGTEGKKI